MIYYGYDNNIIKKVSYQIINKFVKAYLNEIKDKVETCKFNDKYKSFLFF